MHRFKVGKQKNTGSYVGFDLDGTLITTKSGKTFPEDKDDWKLMFDNIPEKLQAIKEDIVIITNQGGKNFNIEDFKEKILNIHEVLKVPFRIYIATKNDRYRKPCTGIYDDYISKKGKLIVYIGDSAGRKKDHADTDYKLSINLNISFQTPELFFLGKDEMKMKISYPVFPEVDNVYKPTKELVILIGMPGAGKTWYCKTHIPHYERINRDELKTKEKCLHMCAAQMTLHHKIVIDNTNPSYETRKEYIKLAKKNGYEYEIIHINTSEECCKHNMMSRSHQRKMDFISSVAYNVYKGKLDLKGVTRTILLPPPLDTKYYF